MKFSISLKSKLQCLAMHLANKYVDENNQLVQSQNINSLFHTIIPENKYNYLNKAKELHQRNLDQKVNMITYFDQEYPILLRHIPDPPFILFYIGPITILKKKTFSIVGSRKPSSFGYHYTQYITDFISKSYSIVSGMAKGIDRVAHITSVKKNGFSIGVIAHGLDHIYPSENYDLFTFVKHKENKNLLLITEYPLGSKPLPYHFRRRNRLISGLSPSLLVAECKKKSGAMITVQYALDQGRNIFALSHPKLMNNAGGNMLLKQGAYDLSQHFPVQIFSIKNAKGLTERIKDHSFIYLGQNKWVKFQPPNNIDLFN